MKRIQYIILCLTLVVLSVSCKVGRKYRQPELVSPTAFLNGTGDTIYNEQILWWDLFDDPVLDTLIATALRNNNDVLAASQRVQAALQLLDAQKLELLPKFGYQAQAQRGNFNLIQTEEVNNAFSAFGNASWEIDLWGRLRRLNENAQARYLSSEYGLAALKLSLVSTVATTYFTLLEYREKEAISRSTYYTRDSSYIVIKQRFDAGIIPEIDLNHAQIQRAIAATSIPNYRRLAVQTENTLRVLLGENPAPVISDSSLDSIHTIPSIPEGLPADLLLRRPDILRAEQDLIAQNALIGVAQANRLPTISLTGLLGYASSELSEFTSGDPAWNVGGGLLGPIFSWGQNIKRVKAEKSKTEAAIYEYRQVALIAFKEVEDALIAIETIKEEETAIRQHVSAAKQALRLSTDRYNKGVASIIEYLEAQRQSFEAEMLLAGNRKQLLSAYIQLYQALGGGWE